MKKYKIFIADDQTLMREALQIVINLEEDMEVIGGAENGRDTIEKVKHLHPDIILMDIQMPIMDGIECTKIIKELYPHIIVLILTTFPEEKYIIEGLANGANGFLIKEINHENLITCIRQAAKGQLMLPSEIASKLAHKLNETYSTKNFDFKIKQLKIKDIDLSEREIEILGLLMNGLKNRHIAQQLFLSEGTVKNYISDIYRKIGVSNRTEAISYIQQL